MLVNVGEGANEDDVVGQDATRKRAHASVSKYVSFWASAQVTLQTCSQLAVVQVAKAILARAHPR